MDHYASGRVLLLSLEQMESAERRPFQNMNIDKIENVLKRKEDESSADYIARVKGAVEEHIKLVHADAQPDLEQGEQLSGLKSKGAKRQARTGQTKQLEGDASAAAHNLPLSSPNNKVIGSTSNPLSFDGTTFSPLAKDSYKVAGPMAGRQGAHATPITQQQPDQCSMTPGDPFTASGRWQEQQASDTLGEWNTLQNQETSKSRDRIPAWVPTTEDGPICDNELTGPCQDQSKENQEPATTVKARPIVKPLELGALLRPSFDVHQTEGMGHSLANAKQKKVRREGSDTSQVSEAKGRQASEAKGRQITASSKQGRYAKKKSTIQRPHSSPPASGKPPMTVPKKRQSQVKAERKAAAGAQSWHPETTLAPESLVPASGETYLVKHMSKSERARSRSITPRSAPVRLTLAPVKVGGSNSNSHRQAGSFDIESVERPHQSPRLNAVSELARSKRLTASTATLPGQVDAVTSAEQASFLELTNQPLLDRGCTEPIHPQGVLDGRVVRPLQPENRLFTGASPTSLEAKSRRSSTQLFSHVRDVSQSAATQLGESQTHQSVAKSLPGLRGAADAVSSANAHPLDAVTSANASRPSWQSQGDSERTGSKVTGGSSKIESPRTVMPRLPSGRFSAINGGSMRSSASGSSGAASSRRTGRAQRQANKQNGEGSMQASDLEIDASGAANEWEVSRSTGERSVATVDSWSGTSDLYRPWRLCGREATGRTAIGEEANRSGPGGEMRPRSHVPDDRSTVEAIGSSMDQLLDPNDKQNRVHKANVDTTDMDGNSYDHDRNFQNKIEMSNTCITKGSGKAKRRKKDQNNKHTPPQSGKKPNGNASQQSAAGRGDKVGSSARILQPKKGLGDRERMEKRGVFLSMGSEGNEYGDQDQNKKLFANWKNDNNTKDWSFETDQGERRAISMKRLRKISDRLLSPIGRSAAAAALAADDSADAMPSQAQAGRATGRENSRSKTAFVGGRSESIRTMVKKRKGDGKRKQGEVKSPGEEGKSGEQMRGEAAKTLSGGKGRGEAGTQRPPHQTGRGSLKPATASNVPAPKPHKAHGRESRKFEEWPQGSGFSDRKGFGGEANSKGFEKDGGNVDATSAQHRPPRRRLFPEVDPLTCNQEEWERVLQALADQARQSVFKALKRGGFLDFFNRFRATSTPLSSGSQDDRSTGASKASLREGTSANGGAGVRHRHRRQAGDTDTRSHASRTVNKKGKLNKQITKQPSEVVGSNPALAVGSGNAPQQEETSAGPAQSNVAELASCAEQDEREGRGGQAGHSDDFNYAAASEPAVEQQDLAKPSPQWKDTPVSVRSTFKSSMRMDRVTERKKMLFERVLKTHADIVMNTIFDPSEIPCLPATTFPECASF
ncbi:hypothetical protein CBR_g66759 [Chara braunii]|uniref:Uncharacterized protein n=1 Tax=Chara braunii TaxID=69332 RepID=A0A388K9L1_CHABU|nr:hypothetical protein CBR_g66759 [Chara braunii]|eukprot:GBG66623.1 hypothetical protein CBR_g66759 [Chara braunii]